MGHLSILGAIRDWSCGPNCREDQQLTEDSPLWTLELLSVHSPKADKISTYPESQSNFPHDTQPPNVRQLLHLSDHTSLLPWRKTKQQLESTGGHRILQTAGENVLQINDTTCVVWVTGSFCRTGGLSRGSSEGEQGR